MLQQNLFAGFGGQGMLLIGQFLAQAGMDEGKYVSWLPSYGPEMRGGTANCSVCISDDAVGSPLVTEPDVLIVMNGPSYDKFINDVKPGGIAIIDSTLISQKCERTDIKCFYVPSTAMADENGLKGMANIILVGKLVKETGIASDEVIKKALEKIIPPAKAHLIEKNLKAIELGKNV